VVGCCECSDEPSGSCATELVFIMIFIIVLTSSVCVHLPLQVFFLLPVAVCASY
jgi:hypothetical protein